jgi:uracil-DNA glycosylase family 4
MDTKDELRRLLRQRIEDGESTIVLESLRAAEIVIPSSSTARAVNSAKDPQGRPGQVQSPRVARDDSTRETLEQRRAGAPEGAGDWRAALKATGATSGKTPTEPIVPAAKAPAPTRGKVVVTPDAPIPQTNSLDDVRAAVATCTRCALYASALNHVPGEGNHNADFMVVGEAPGQTEDEQGKPFVGRAGQLLTQILEAIKLSRDDVFICNVLKHRPPGNRNPEPDEVKACSPYLIRQIELVQPKVILALGTFSAQTLLDTKTSIGKLRGQVHEYHGVPVVVTYHPAALLRNPAWKRPTWEDVQLARRILDSAPPRGS